MIDLCREKGYPVSIETNNDGDDEEAHVSSILSKIKTFDHSKVCVVYIWVYNFESFEIMFIIIVLLLNHYIIYIF